jgi:hypothetical protein
MERKKKYEFYWTSNLPDDTRISAEEAIRDAQESGHSPITFCHDGTAIVTISSPDPLQMTLVGNMKCSCGVPQGVVTGKSDGSNIVLEAVKM